MRYTLTFSWLNEQKVKISIHSVFSSPKETWQIPYWRPGRYAAQEYPRNVFDFRAYTDEGRPVEWQRAGSHQWELVGRVGTPYTLEYFYYANQLDAGGSYIQDDMIYINGINVCMYQVGREKEACELYVELPEGFEMGGNTWDSGYAPATFSSYHALVDTPFVAGKNLQQMDFKVQDLSVNVTLAGGYLPSLPEFTTHLQQIIVSQIPIFGEVPISRYTFWILLLPQKGRHGVEHLDSTVIVIGPEASLYEKEVYYSLLEICSHEFFHVWNVKSIRPNDLFPYAYHKPQYTDLHYITEGITTYYGYLMLWRSQLCNFEDWIGYVNRQIRDFYLSGGGPYISLREASVNSWVNGYSWEGAPNRRISFYTKGHLVALLLDFLLQRDSQHRVRLDTILKTLYQRAMAKGGGFVQADLTRILEDWEIVDFSAFSQQYLEGVHSLVPLFQQVGDFLGLNFVETAYPSVSESLLGVKTQIDGQGRTLVQDMLPEVGEALGLIRGDELLALEGLQVSANWKNLLMQFRGKEVTLHIFRRGKLRQISMLIPEGIAFTIPQFAFTVSPSEEQLQARKKWGSQ